MEDLEKEGHFDAQVMKSSSSTDLAGKTSKQRRSNGFTILLLAHKINSKYRGKAGALKRSGPGLKCCLSPLLWISVDFRQTYSLGLLRDAIPGTLVFASLVSTVSTQESTEVISHQWLADAHINFLKEKGRKKERKLIWQNHHTVQQVLAAPVPPSGALGVHRVSSCFV